MLSDYRKIGSSKKKVGDAAVAALWELRLITNKRGGGLAKLLANVILVLDNDDAWKGALAWDEFANAVVIVKQCPAGPPGAWDDVADLRATNWLQLSRHKLEVGDDLVSKAARAVADKNRIHPVRDWLRSLTWDKTKRIDGWLVRYFGVEDSVYARAVGRRFLISAVARIFKPGCQVDTMLILEGDQGVRKSSALRALTSDEWFLDAAIDVRNPEAASALRKKWIVEFSELAALKGGDVERVKQFVSTRVDNYRQKYGRYFEDYPRQCVLVGSTNAKHYLKDETGARRFWPMRVTLVDLEALVADREQLWAEAVAAFEADEPWYLDNADLRAAAEVEQEHRRVVDPWEDAIAEYLDVPTRRNASVRIGDVLLDCLKLEVSKRTRAEEMRVGAILAKLGWERRRVRASSDASSRVYVYEKTSGRDGRDAGRDTNSVTESNVRPTVPTVPTSSTKGSLERDANQRHLIGNGRAGRAVGTDDDDEHDGHAFSDMLGEE